MNNPPNNIQEYISLRMTPSAYFWNIPPTNDCPVNLYIIEDEKGMRTLDNGPGGWHPTTNPELIRLIQFKIYLNRTEQCGL